MILDLQQVSKRYQGPRGEVRALADATLSLDAGDFVAIQGPSGCGKSTLLLVAGALLQPDAGAVRIGGQDPYALSADARAQHRARWIGFVFQQFHLIPYLSVRDNVLAPALALADGSPAQRADALLQRFGLLDRADHRPAALSTGERQRVALARALLNQPRLLLADEPTGNLDPDNARLVLDGLSAFARDGGAVLLVTHDAHAAGCAQRALRMRQGRLQTAPDAVAAAAPAAPPAGSQEPSP